MRRSWCDRRSNMCSASSRASKWFRTRTVWLSTQGSPDELRKFIAFKFGRCSPVATRTVMPEVQGTPAATQPSRSAGAGKVPLGTGLVMSQIRMQALVRPCASSARDGAAIALSNASRIAARPSASLGSSALRITVGSASAGSAIGSAVRPKAISICLRFTLRPPASLDDHWSMVPRSLPAEKVPIQPEGRPHPRLASRRRIGEHQPDEIPVKHDLPR